MIVDHTLESILIYFLLISLVTLLLFGYDKYKARAGYWRTPENTLLLFCLLGGSIGGGLGMLLFRHKTSKRSFLTRYYLVLTLQVITLGGLFAYQMKTQSTQERKRQGIIVEVQPL